MGDESDLRERMRLGMTGAVRRLGGARRVSGTSLVALLCASALAPVVAAGVVVGPVLLAGVGVVGAVGAGVLTEVVTGVVDRLRGNGKEISQASVEKELALKLEEALVSQGDSASALREAVAALLRGVDAIAAVNETGAARDQTLMLAVAEGFAGLDERFSEFSPVIEDIRLALWDLQESARQQEADRRVEQERAREDSLTLLQMRETLLRWGAAATGPADLGGMDPMWSGCPYLGLLPFEERDARVFYGRSELVRQLVQRMLEHLDSGGILLVVGASGAGKSSLLRAGLLPSLAAGALGPGSAMWPRRVIRPTGSPMRELARHLADMAGLEPVSVYGSLSAAPGETPLLVDRAVSATAGLGGGPGTDMPDSGSATVPPRLVLVVDQFEEMFTAGDGSDAGRGERDAFVDALHAAATRSAGPRGVPGALIVVAVRGDFLDRAIIYPPLEASVQAGPFAVGPMNEAELREAITGPAAEAGLDAKSDLVDAVVSELREREDGGLGSGALPLMSQAMAATWERRESNELTLRAYRRAGGITDAVNRSARAAYHTLTRSQQDVARVVFTRLTSISRDGQLARRRCSHAELYSAQEEKREDVDAVIGVFSARRLLVLSENSIEISHDALLGAWTQLKEWLGDDQLDRALYGQILTDADTWDAHQRDSSYLYRSTRLAAIDAAADRWAKAPSRYPPLPPASAAFLRAAYHAERRSARRRRAVISGLLALTLIAITLAGIAAYNAANATRQHAASLSRQLAAESLLIDPTDPVTARRLAVAAWRVSPTDQARSVMQTLLTEQQQDGILPADPSGVYGVAFSPQGKLLASAGADGAVRLWNPATSQPVRTIQADTTGRNPGVFGVAFSPDGKLLASADFDGTVRLWDPATGRLVRTISASTTGPQTGVNGVAFSPDGKLLASADIDSTVRLWDPATGRPTRTIQVTGPIGIVKGVAFSPDGKLLASADGDGSVRLWDPASGRSVHTIPADPNPGVFGVAFSPDGKLLASADVDGTVRLWDPATGQSARTIPASTTVTTDPTGIVNGVAFSPDGKLLASGYSDGLLRLWELATGQVHGPVLRAGSGPVGGVAFSPSGSVVAAAADDGAIGLWDPATGQPVRPPLQAGSGVNGVAFSPDGKLLASAGVDGTVRLWDPATGQPIFAFHAGTTPGMAGVAFSPDGKLLASADADGTVALWDPATGRAVGAIQADTTGPYTGVNGVAFSPDGKLLASAGVDGAVKLWEVSPSTNPYAALSTNPYAALCTDVGSPTPQDWHQYAAGEPEPGVCA